LTFLIYFFSASKIKLNYSQIIKLIKLKDPKIAI
jgi:hypothetical protein